MDGETLQMLLSGGMGIAIAFVSTQVRSVHILVNSKQDIQSQLLNDYIVRMDALEGKVHWLQTVIAGLRAEELSSHARIREMEDYMKRQGASG